MSYKSIDLLRIYVLWHPDCYQGKEYAKAIFNWFYLPISQLHHGGLDVPVNYRFKGRDQEGRAPRQIKLAEAEINVIVPLVDQNMVKDPTWRDYLQRLAVPEITPKGRQCPLFPVALHRTAYNLPPPISELNYIRVNAQDDTIISSPDDLFKVKRDRLLFHLTEAICRLLLAQNMREFRNQTDNQPPPVQIFLSHAKADGTLIAESIRDYIYQSTQIKVFYDENDLAIGNRFEKELKSKASVGTDAMIIVYTDAYPFRPWCLRELALANTPRNYDEAATIFSVSPLLVVSALSGSVTQALDMVDNVPVIGWQKGAEPLILNTIVREIFLAAYYFRQARQAWMVAQKLNLSKNDCMISWTPNLRSILELKKKYNSIKRIIYPGFGLTDYEQKSFQKVSPGIKFATFRQIRKTMNERKNTNTRFSLENRVIALSISDSEEQQSLGYRKEHLVKIALLIAHRCIRNGANLAYGGDFRREYTQELFAMVRREQGDPESSISGRVFNYLAWPYYLDLTADVEAEYVNYCTFVRIDQKTSGLGQELSRPKKKVNSPQIAYHKFRTLSHMRHLMVEGAPARTVSNRKQTRGLFARIILGGKTAGFSGIMPGIWEESFLTLKKKRPLFIIGGFGGAARILADVLRGKENISKLSLELQLKRTQELQILIDGIHQFGNKRSIKNIYANHDCEIKIYSEFAEIINDAQSHLEHTLNNGLNNADNVDLMMTEDIEKILDLIDKGLRKLASQ